MARAARPPNRLLALLASADFELIGPHLKTIELVHETVLFKAGDPIKRVYFPHNGIISLVVGLRAGRIIEAAMIGCDSVVGASSALGSGYALNKGVVLSPGVASVIDVSRLRKAAVTSVALRETLFRHERAMFAQAQQSAACNASHSIEARLACWLLRTRDLIGGDTLPVTQQLLGQMLGVQRTGVSSAASTLQKAGKIKYAWGRVQVTDLKGLNAGACECYRAVKANYRRLLIGAR